MKNILIINLLAIAFFLTNGLFAQSTNDFYDVAETYLLKGNTGLEIAGEIANPGHVD